MKARYYWEIMDYGGVRYVEAKMLNRVVGAWERVRGAWTALEEAWDHERRSALKARQAASWAAEHPPWVSSPPSDPGQSTLPQGNWIGTVLASLGEHIRRLEDENRELKQTAEYLWEEKRRENRASAGAVDDAATEAVDGRGAEGGLDDDGGPRAHVPDRGGLQPRGEVGRGEILRQAAGAEAGRVEPGPGGGAVADAPGIGGERAAAAGRGRPAEDDRGDADRPRPAAEGA